MNPIRFRITALLWLLLVACHLLVQLEGSEVCFGLSLTGCLSLHVKQRFSMLGLLVVGRPLHTFISWEWLCLPRVWNSLSLLGVLNRKLLLVWTS